MCSDWVQSVQEETREFWNYSTESPTRWEEKDWKTESDIWQGFSAGIKKEEEAYNNKQKNDKKVGVAAQDLSADDDISGSSVSSSEQSFQTPLSAAASSENNAEEEANVVGATIEDKELTGVIQEAWL